MPLWSVRGLLGLFTGKVHGHCLLTVTPGHAGREHSPHFFQRPFICIGGLKNEFKGFASGHAPRFPMHKGGLT
jgi:hypothetical protein